MPNPPLNSNLPENVVRTSRTFQLVLAAANNPQSIQRIPQAGVRFYIVESNSDAGLLIKTDKTSDELFTVGTGKEFSEEQYFTALQITNENPVPITITLFAGFGDYIDKRTTIVGNRLQSILPTIEPVVQAFSVKVVGVPVTAIAGGADIPTTGTPTPTQLRRKAILVSNLDPNLNLQLKDQDGNICHTIFNNTCQIIPVSGIITLHNPNGSSISCQFTELWWMKP